MEPFRRHADDGEWSPVDPDDSPNCGTIETVTRLPERMADDGHLVDVLRVIALGGRKEPSDRGLDAHDIEVTAGNQLAIYELAAQFIADGQRGRPGQAECLE